jgi:lipopolysaccharide transport system ATP-binding protein
MPFMIQIKNLGKKYKVAGSLPYLSLRDSITKAAGSIFTKKQGPNEFWALHDIDLEVNEGERLGIIGRNGAGKSTLLKIISRISPPTTGSIILRGNVASLLEVGTGFHPELTGKENIYLNGSILGLKKKDIDQRYDEIVDFSGVSAFINTPLKHFSTGMQLRLAFAVAAHLKPEILLIDEVLAVGDMEFQKKCLQKMEEVSREQARSIVFVSHNMNYISSLCDKVIWLDKGRIVESGQPSTVIGNYMSSTVHQTGNSEWKNIETAPGDQVVRLRSIAMVDEQGNKKELFGVTEKIGIQMEYEVLESGNILWLGYNIFNREMINVFDTHNVSSEQYQRPHEKGRFRAIAWIPPQLMNTGGYTVGCAIFNHLLNRIHFHEKDALAFSVYDELDKPTARGMSPGDFPGVIRPVLAWDIYKL